MKKNKLDYILSPSVNILFILDGCPHTIKASDIRFQKAVDYCVEGKVKKLKKLVKTNNEVAVAVAAFDDSSKLSIKGDKVFYNGNYEITGALASTLIELAKQGFKDVSRFEKFVERLLKNPSSSSVKEFFDFMSYKNLPITEDGKIMAYKSVDSNFWSHHGNPKTVVLSGEVDSSGRIKNSIGAVIEVARNQVDDDREVHCSYGLHAGSWDYAQGFHSNKKMLLVEIDPQDVVSVPSDCQCQKVRVCKYKVVQEIPKELSIATVDTKSDVLAQDQKTDAEILAGDIESVLNSFAEKGKNKVKAKKVKEVLSTIQNNVKSSAILNIAVDLGYPIEHGESSGKSKIVLGYTYDDEDDGYYHC